MAKLYPDVLCLLTKAKVLPSRSDIIINAGIFVDKNMPENNRPFSARIWWSGRWRDRPVSGYSALV